MEGTYDVMLGSQKKGSVTVIKQGLYWLFDCRCDLSGEVMYDLVIRVGDQQVKLGLLTPGNGIFCLYKKLPIKRLGQGSPVFSLQPRHPKACGQFIPIHPDEPFQYLSRLENAYLKKQGSQIGITFSE